MLPKQILLNNLLSDLPAITISTDNVGSEQVGRPQRWSVPRVRRFMIVFGLISSCFDLATFTLLLFIFHANAETFHTMWFLVSLLTELVVMLVLRTLGPFYRSRPSRLLLGSTMAMAAVTCALPYLGVVSLGFSFVPLQAAEMAAALAIVLAYALATEATKHLFE